jgi:ParB family chromosome partitioning protein
MAEKRSGLGKGLGALLSVREEIEQANSGVSEILLDDIRPNPHQPRTDFNSDDLDELKQSILEHGLIQPIIVKQVDRGYELIAGERRYRAAKLAKLKNIPAIVREISEEDQAKLALVENLQRQDLNPIEEALGYEKLLESYALTQQELSKSLGKSRSHITNSMRLLSLPEKVISAIRKGELTAGHGRAILMFPETKQEDIAKQAIDHAWSVRFLETLSKKPLRETKPVIKQETDPHLNDLEQKLTEAFGSKVILKPGKKKHIMEVTFYNDEDLQKILNKLL